MLMFGLMFGNLGTSSKWEVSSPLLALRPVLALNLGSNALPPVNQLLHRAYVSRQPAILVPLVSH